MLYPCPSDGSILTRVATLAVDDLEAGGAPAVVTGQLVDTHADEVGDEEALGDVGDQLVRRSGAGREMQIARPGRGRRRHAALGVPGGLERQLARGGGIEEPGLEHAVLDHREA